jgi:hypothetical protein
MEDYFCQVLNVHGVNDVRQTEMHTDEPLATEPSSFEVEIAIEKPKRYKSSGIDQNPAELIQAGDNKLRSEIHKLINSLWTKEELTRQCKEYIIDAIIVPAYRRSDTFDWSHYGGISLLPTTFKNLSNNFSLKANSICRRNYWGS